MNKKTIVYTLLILQLVLTFPGSANEFEDYLFGFILTLIFFILQLFLLYKLTPKRGVTIFISIFALLHLLDLGAFIQDGVSIISNKYPADIYYSTKNWVLLMLIGSVLFDLIKIVVLHIGKIRRIKTES